MTALYVESSALLRALIEGDAGLLHVLDTHEGDLVTSTLTLVEANRAIVRARGDARLDDEREREVRNYFAELQELAHVMEMTPAILRRAGEPFPREPVRALDAIHLSSLLDWASTIGPIHLCSVDDRLRTNAEALGFEVRP